MTTVRLDHFITFADTPSLEQHLQTYRDAGFLVYVYTVRHGADHRNGFVGFGPEYIEFLCVEDEVAFSKAAAATALHRAGRRPFAIGLVSDDVRLLHEAWTARGYVVPPVFSKAPHDAPADTPPVWSFQPIPESLRPGGAGCAILTYHAKRSRPLQAAPNTMYAIAAVTFVSATPGARAIAWRDLFAPEAPVQERNDGVGVTIGPHDVLWLTPERYQEQYGRQWEPAPHPDGELAVLHVLATDLAAVAVAMTTGGREVVEREDSTGRRLLFLPPDGRDGFTFAVTERPSEEWRTERIAHTAEAL